MFWPFQTHQSTALLSLDFPHFFARWLKASVYGRITEAFVLEIVQPNAAQL